MVRNDLPFSAKIIQYLDAGLGLWSDEGLEAARETTASSSAFAVASRNPVLHNITDYLIKEASAEEEELLQPRMVRW